MKKVLLLSILLLVAACSQSDFDAPDSIKVTSAFSNGEKISEIYTCDGQNVNPFLNIENVPEDSKSLVVILEDPDAEGGTFTHWIAFNTPKEIRQDYQGNSGLNDFGSVGYGGPCPPEGTHRYYFKVYSLDKKLSFENPPKKKQIIEAMEGHVLARGELMGKYG